MPLLNRRFRAARPETTEAGTGLSDPDLPLRRGLLDSCSNPRCRSGWLQVWRSRSVPVFEAGWCCSRDCMAERIETAVRREMNGHGPVSGRHLHRIPLGLVMIEQGWITAEQLRQALNAQKTSGGRLGHCLVRSAGVSERDVTRAVSLQWNCPVLGLEVHDPGSLSSLMPRLFVDAFRSLPLRVAAGQLVYLGFEDHLDPVLALGLERMSGLRVESGLVEEAQFRPAHERMLRALFPAVELLDASGENSLVHALVRAVERERPVESRLVRVHDCLWLRMWTRPQRGPLPEADSIRDVIAAISA